MNPINGEDPEILETIDRLFWNWYMDYYDLWNKFERKRFTDEAIRIASVLGIEYRQCPVTGELKKLGLDESQYSKQPKG